MKRTVSTLLILSTLLLTLAACGGNEETKGTGTSGTSGTSAATTAEPTKPAEPDPFDDLADSDPVYGTQYVFDDYSPYIQGEKLTEISIDPDTADKLVAEFLAEVLASYQGVDFVDAPENATVAMRDRATIYYTGYSADPSITISEETLANMTNKGSESGHGLVIGSNSFILAYESAEHPEKNNPGFEEQLIGTKVGDTVTITVTFPDDYKNSVELRGVVVKFDVTIEKIENPDPNEPTELTDELVKDYTGGQFNTITELINYKKNDCKAQLAYEAVSSKINIIAYPEAEYNELLESYMDYYTYEGISEEDLAALRESGDKAVKEIIDEELTLNYLYSLYDIKLTKSEYFEKLQAFYEENAMVLSFYYGVYTAGDMEDYFSRDYFISYFKSELLSSVLAEKAIWNPLDTAPSGSADE